MLIQITNELLTARIDTFGAELKSVRDRASGLEYLWQGDKKIWKDTSPLLFPVVARQLDDWYMLDGKKYAMPMHGFAKDREFTLLSQEASCVRLQLLPDRQTFGWYPFDFCLISEFVLEGRQLTVRRCVMNRGTAAMPFSIGEHTGYRVPLLPEEAPEAYCLRFSSPEKAARWYLSDEILCGSEPGLSGDCLPVTGDMFRRGALIFKHLHADAVCLAGPAHVIRVGLDGWDYLGLWAKPGAPYLCIEPWNGLASSRWSSHDIWRKEGIRRLEPDAEVQFAMCVCFE